MEYIGVQDVPCGRSQKLVAVAIWAGRSIANLIAPGKPHEFDA